MKYGVVVVDPPWNFGDKLQMSKTKRGAASHYQTMREAELLTLPVQDLTAQNAVLALWVPSSFMDLGMRVVRQWGFVQKQVYTWVKTTKDGEGLAFGMGHHFRGCTEHALIGVRGHPRPLSRSQRNAETSPCLPHSQKPETLQDRLEMMYPGPFLELFARRDRKGWTCVGNECPATEGVDIKEWLVEHRPTYGDK